MKRVLIFFLLCLPFFCMAQLVVYAKATAAPAENVSASGLSRVNGAAMATGCTSGFHSQGWSQAITFSPGLSAIEFSIAPTNGHSLNLSSISADLRRDGNLPEYGPKKCRFAYSTDGGATWIYAATDSAPGGTSCSNFTNRTWDFPDFTTAGAVWFRIYGYEASGPTKTLTVRNLTVSGSVN